MKWFTRLLKVILAMYTSFTFKDGKPSKFAQLHSFDTGQAPVSQSVSDKSLALAFSIYTR